MTATSGDLALLLNLGTSINVDRAAFLLEQATDMCLSIVNPLPAGSDSVVLDVAARAYSNPSAQQFSAPGPYGPSGTTPMLGGLWLTRENKAMLRRLAPGSSGGAFSIDPTPADAGALDWWPQRSLGIDVDRACWDWPPSG